MGEDKACLVLDGKTMLQRSVELLQSLGAQEVFVSRNEFVTDYLPDIYPGMGPLGGIHAALFETELPIVIIPVDMPLLDKCSLQPIVSAGLASQTPCCYQDHPLPLFLPNRWAFSIFLEQRLSQPKGDKSQMSIRAFLRHFGTLQLTPSDDYKLANANTPKQWQYCTQQC